MTELAPGVVFAGRYQLQHVLGDGGYGRVYEAQDLEVGRRVALKVLRPDTDGGYSTEKRERYRREAATVANLRDPHTVTLFDHGETSDGLLYMVFEFVDGTPLSQVLRGGALPADVATRVVRQVAQSLREAHSAGVLHRDLKPANIIIYEYGSERHHAKLVDFGLAKNTVEARAQTPLTQSGLVMGTAAYVAPEAYLLRPVSPASDIFGLGLVYYEMVVGQAANRGGSPMEIATRMVDPQEFVVPPSVPQPIRGIITKMIRKQVQERYQSAEEFLRDLPEATQTGQRQRELSAEHFEGTPIPNLEEVTRPSLPAFEYDPQQPPTLVEGEGPPSDIVEQAPTLIQPHLQLPSQPLNVETKHSPPPRRGGGVIGFTLGLVILLVTASATVIHLTGIRLPWEPKPVPLTAALMPPKEFDLKSPDTVYFYVDWSTGILLAQNPSEVPASGRCALILDSMSRPTPGGIYYVIDAVEPVDRIVTAHALGPEDLAAIAGRCDKAAKVADSLLLSAEILAAETKIASVEKRNELRSKRRKRARQLTGTDKPPTQQDMSKILKGGGGMDLIKKFLMPKQ